MIGRIDSTPDPRLGRLQDRASRRAAFLAIAALIVVGGLAASTSPTLAQAPAKKAKATVTGTEPSADPVPAIPDQPPAAMPRPAGSMALPAPVDDEPKIPTRRDDRVRPAAIDEAPPDLPGATNPPGGAPSTPGSGPASDPFFLPTDRMGPGKQRVQLSVEVQASPIINLGKELTVRLVVKNESNVDASGVSLVYQLPEGLKLNSSTPAGVRDPGHGVLSLAQADAGRQRRVGGRPQGGRHHDQALRARRDGHRQGRVRGPTRSSRSPSSRSRPPPCPAGS